MNEDVYEEEKDDHKEPDVDQFDGRAGGQRTRHVREERVEHQQRREGHDGAGVEGVQAQEERRPAHQQEQSRRQESGHHDHAGAPPQIVLQDHPPRPRRLADLDFLDGVQCQVLGADVSHPRLFVGEPDGVFIFGWENDFNRAGLDIEGVTKVCEYTHECSGVVLGDG